MLDVALEELPGGGAQKMCARECGPATSERHDVLELVAEAVGATRLIEGGSRPHAASERLIEQPAIEHDVHRPIRRFHLNRAEHVVPVLRSTARKTASRSAVR